MQLRILVAPLDWGLGHASRCIPIINFFLSKGSEVILASSAQAGMLLRQEFPQLTYLELPSYQIRLTPGANQGFYLIKQIPRIHSIIKEEHQYLKKIIADYQVDVVLSDNRYGLWSNSIPSIFMTHQLTIKPPFAQGLLEKPLRLLHYSFIKKFRCCWVPDFEGENNLSGNLSHACDLPPDTWYIGPQSRLYPIDSKHDREISPNYILAVLSGPEPQRSLLEEKLTQQLLKIKIPARLIQGIPGGPKQHKISDTLEIFPYLNSIQLHTEIKQASHILCRSGYSSLMDMAFSGTTAIFIPTPGQTEQEYLAEYHKKAGHYYSEPQGTFDLERAISEAKTYHGLCIKPSPDGLEAAFKNILGYL